MRRLFAWLLLGALAAGCTAAAPEQGGKADQPLTLVDPNYPPAVGGTNGWQYHQTLSADFDSDGAAETLHVTTRAFWLPDDQAWGWDDGQPWHVYIEEADGARTYLFSRWVQLGQLEVGLAADQPDIIILQRASSGISAYRIKYTGPQRAEGRELMEVPVLNWAWFTPESRPKP